jgi:anti-sigma factor RsiW
MTCAVVRTWIFAYLTGDLDAMLRRAVEAHVIGCLPCRRLLESELTLSMMAPAGECSPAPAHVRRRTELLLADLVRRQRARRIARRARMSIAAGLLVTAALGAVSAIPRLLERAHGVGAVVAAAVDQHRKIVSGGLPSEVSEDRPGRTEAWLNGRLSFAVSLPAPPPGNQRLVGARVARLLDTDVAAVAYRVDAAPVSLFVLPEATYRRLKLADAPEFHAFRHDDYDVILWRRGSVGYALVSEIGDRACRVCHAPALAVPNL